MVRQDLLVQETGQLVHFVGKLVAAIDRLARAARPYGDVPLATIVDIRVVAMPRPIKPGWLANRLLDGS